MHRSFALLLPSHDRFDMEDAPTQGVTPLRWPEGWPRSRSRAAARLDVSLDKATQELRWEIKRLSGTYPLATHSKFPGGRDPADSGVAVYFTVKGKQRVFACDRWHTVRNNIRAISKTIEALRGIERWGASEMMDRAFDAFTALPSPSWRRPRCSPSAKRRHGMRSKRATGRWPSGIIPMCPAAAKEAAHREMAA